MSQFRCDFLIGKILVIDDDPQVLAVAVKRLEFARGADLFVCEAQYTEEEYPTRKAWVHSTTEDALRMAAQAAVRQLAIFHHDPTHDDEFMDRMVQVCQQRTRSANYPFACFAAMEGQVVEL